MYSLPFSLDHWASVNTKVVLDAQNSDILYKHHITRLADIYQNRQIYRFDSYEIPSAAPATLLYGVQGTTFCPNLCLNYSI